MNKHRNGIIKYLDYYNLIWITIGFVALSWILDFEERNLCEIIRKVISDGTDWIVSVKDRGNRIPDEYKENIFERFKRIEKRGVYS